MNGFELDVTMLETVQSDGLEAQLENMNQMMEHARESGDPETAKYYEGQIESLENADETTMPHEKELQNRLERAMREGDTETANYYQRQLERQGEDAELGKKEKEKPQPKPGGVECGPIARAGDMSFGGRARSVKELEEQHKHDLKKVTQMSEYYERDVTNGRDNTFSSNDLKYATNAAKRSARELERAKGR